MRVCRAGDRWKLICLVGPSGCGKTTIMQDLRLPILKSTTTRPPRSKKDHEEYTFISEAQFDRHLEAGNFIESISRTGYRYGILKSDVAELKGSTQPYIRIVTYDGFLALRNSGVFRYGDESVGSIFIMASYQECLDRLRKRNLPVEELMERMKLYTRECQEAKNCHFVVHNNNGEYDACLETIKNIIRFSQPLFCDTEDENSLNFDA